MGYVTLIKIYKYSNKDKKNIKSQEDYQHIGCKLSQIANTVQLVMFILVEAIS